jgi:hypothetical protein
VLCQTVVSQDLWILFIGVDNTQMAQPWMSMMIKAGGTILIDLISEANVHQYEVL